MKLGVQHFTCCIPLMIGFYSDDKHSQKRKYVLFIWKCMHECNLCLKPNGGSKRERRRSKEQVAFKLLDDFLLWSETAVDDWMDGWWKARAHLHVCNVSAKFVWNLTISNIRIAQWVCVCVTCTGTYKLQGTSCEMDLHFCRPWKAKRTFWLHNQSYTKLLFFFRVLFLRSFLIMKSKLWMCCSKKKSNYNQFPRRNIYVDSVALTHKNSHWKPRAEDLHIRISWFYTLWEFVGFPFRWESLMMQCTVHRLLWLLALYVISVWNVV